MKPCILLITTLFAAAASAIDYDVCCFANAFATEGRFKLYANGTGADIGLSTVVEGTAKVMADFTNKKFAANFVFTGRTPNDLKKKLSAKATVILDANRTNNALWYARTEMDTEERRQKCEEFWCAYGALTSTLRIKDYQCLPRHVLRNGDENYGRKEMLVPLEILDGLSFTAKNRIQNNIKVFFDLTPCAASKIQFNAKFRSFHHDLLRQFTTLANPIVHFDFNADLNAQINTVPSIPDDLRECDSYTKEMKPLSEVTDKIMQTYARLGLRR